jgi:hypothetical protein
MIEGVLIMMLVLLPVLVPAAITAWHTLRRLPFLRRVRIGAGRLRHEG